MYSYMVYMDPMDPMGYSNQTREGDQASPPERSAEIQEERDPRAGVGAGKQLVRVCEENYITVILPASRKPRLWSERQGAAVYRRH